MGLNYTCLDLIGDGETVYTPPLSLVTDGVLLCQTLTFTWRKPVSGVRLIGPPMVSFCASLDHKNRYNSGDLPLFRATGDVGQACCSRGLDKDQFFLGDQWFSWSVESGACDWLRFWGLEFTQPFPLFEFV